MNILSYCFVKVLPYTQKSLNENTKNTKISFFGFITLAMLFSVT